MKHILSTSALLLSGCATDCYQSGVCRTVIGALPPQIEAARNDERVMRAKRAHSGG